jgi:hypothetical protein
MTLPSIKTWLRMAWQLALTLFFLSLILEVLETYLNIGQARSIIFAPLSFFRSLTSRSDS